MSRLIAVDPGKSSGIAAMTRGELISVARVQSEPTDPWPKIAAIKAALRSLDVPTTRGGKLVGSRVLFVTEAQFIGRDARSAMSVVRNAAAWEVCASVLGCVVLPQEHPTSWQSAYGWHGKGRSTSWRKRQMQRVIDERFAASMGPLREQIDVQCAIFLGTIAAMRVEGWQGEKAVACEGFEWVRIERSKHVKGRDAYKRRKGVME